MKKKGIARSELVRDKRVEEFCNLMCNLYYVVYVVHYCVVKRKWVNNKIKRGDADHIFQGYVYVYTILWFGTLGSKTERLKSLVDSKMKFLRTVPWCSILNRVRNAYIRAVLYRKTQLVIT